MCERWVGDWTNCDILTPSSFVFCSTSFSFCWAARSGVLRAHSPLLGAGSLSSILSPTNWLQLTELPVAPGYIIVCRPPAFFRRHICTQFNPSTVKVIPWYLRPDAPVIYTSAFLIWQLGRGSVCYNSWHNVACWGLNSVNSLWWPKRGLFLYLSSGSKGSAVNTNYFGRERFWVVQKSYWIFYYSQPEQCVEPDVHKPVFVIIS